MSKIYIEGLTAQEKLKTGVNKLANLVKLTIGPKGRNIVLDRKFTTPLITNDGVTIAREFELSEPYENMGVKLIKEVCNKTNDIAGDGTTTAIVLAQKMLNEGLKLCTNHPSPILINKGIVKAKDFCIALLKKKSKKITNSKEIENIATISSQNQEVGKLIAKAYENIGSTGNITLQDSKTATTEVIFQDGMSLNKGYLSAYFCNNEAKTQVLFNDSYLLVTDEKITNFSQLLPILEQIIETNKPLTIICDDIDNETLSALIINKVRGNFNCCVIKAPLFGDKKQALLEDIASICDTKIISNANGTSLENVNIEQLGLLKQIKVTNDKTTFISSKINKERLDERINCIKNQIENCNIDYDKEQLKNRLANLTGGVATILVGANTDIEQQEKKLRIEDAISATASALEQGVVSGGGIALFKLKKDLKKFIKTLKNEEKLGAEIVFNTLDAPLCQILENACISKDIVLSKIIKNNNLNYGYDALNDRYCDMIKSGIIDPTKVVISALSNAVSVVTTMLTTEGLVSDAE